MPTENHQNTTAYLIIVASHVFLVMSTVCHLPKAAPSHNVPCHKAQVIELNPAKHLCGTGDFYPESVALSCQYELKSLKLKCSRTLLNLCHKALKQFLRQNRVQSCTSKTFPSIYSFYFNKYSVNSLDTHVPCKDKL